jgi:hypothetical protein
MHTLPRIIEHKVDLYYLGIISSVSIELEDKSMGRLGGGVDTVEFT